MNAPYRTLLLCTALVGVAGMAQAQSTGLTRTEIEAAYADFERIEISFGPTQVKVEALDAQTGQVVEAIYDRATGAILKEETGSVAGPVGTGVEVKSRTEDFVRVRASDDATPGLDRAFDDTPRGQDDDGIDDTTGGDDDDHDDDSARASSQAGGAQASGAQASGDRRGRGRSGGSDDDGSDDDSGHDDSGHDDSGRGGSGRGGSDDSSRDGDDD